MIDPGLQDRVALITGANHGIGAATARTLALHGAKVAIAYLDGEPPSMAGVEGPRAVSFHGGEVGAGPAALTATYIRLRRWRRWNQGTLGPIILRLGAESSSSSP